MSAASPAQPQVRRNAAAAPSRSAQPQTQHAQHQHAPAQHAPAHHAAAVDDFSRPRGAEAMHLSLGDIPVQRTTLEVEGLRPSLLSRLFDMISPLDRR